MKKSPKKPKVSHGLSTMKSAVNKIRNARLIQLNISTKEKVRLREVKSVCNQLCIDLNNEPPEIINTINLFIWSDLDEGWEREEDELNKMIYYYKPDNFSCYDHPHLDRLKSTLNMQRMMIEQREKLRTQLETEKSIKILNDLKL